LEQVTFLPVSQDIIPLNKTPGIPIGTRPVIPITLTGTSFPAAADTTTISTAIAATGTTG